MTYTVHPGSAPTLLFRLGSAAFPLVSDKNSAGFCTGENRVIPAEIRGFSTRFATGFRALYQQRFWLQFHQLFGLLSEADPAAGKGRKAGGIHNLWKSSAPHDTTTIGSGPRGTCTHNVARGTIYRLRVKTRRSRRRRRMSLRRSSEHQARDFPVSTTSLRRAPTHRRSTSVSRASARSHACVRAVRA